MALAVTGAAPADAPAAARPTAPSLAVRRVRAFWAAHRPRGWVLGAMVAGLTLRLAWTAVATPRHFELYSDPYEYLSYSHAIAHFQRYTINGHVTAFFPGGWPLLLSPSTWLADRTGWFRPELGASVVTALIGTFSIGATAHLAALWLGRRVAVVAAWLVATAPALIGVTTTPLSETPYTAALLVLLILVSRVIQRPAGQEPGWKALVGFGVFVGYVMLIRSSGLTMLPLAGLLLAVRRRSLRPVARAAPWVVAGSLLVLAPMAAWNWYQIGWLSPFSTNQAGTVCMGNHDGASGGYVDDPVFLAQCHWGAPHGVFGLEAKWAGQMPGQALRWAVHHPDREYHLTIHKTYLVLGQDRNAGSISYLEYLHSIPDGWVGPAWRAIEGWRALALLLAAAGLIRSRRLRHAPVLWLTPLSIVMICWAGAAAGRMNLPVLPFLAILAATTLVSDADEVPDGQGAAPRAVEPGATDPTASTPASTGAPA